MVGAGPLVLPGSVQHRPAVRRLHGGAGQTFAFGGGSRLASRRDFLGSKAFSRRPPPSHFAALQAEPRRFSRGRRRRCERRSVVRGVGCVRSSLRGRLVLRPCSPGSLDRPRERRRPGDAVGSRARKLSLAGCWVPDPGVLPVWPSAHLDGGLDDPSGHRSRRILHHGAGEDRHRWFFRPHVRRLFRLRGSGPRPCLLRDLSLPGTEGSRLSAVPPSRRYRGGGVLGHERLPRERAHPSRRLPGCRRDRGLSLGRGLAVLRGHRGRRRGAQSATLVREGSGREPVDGNGLEPGGSLSRAPAGPSCHRHDHANLHRRFRHPLSLAGPLRGRRACGVPESYRGARLARVGLGRPAWGSDLPGMDGAGAGSRAFRDRLRPRATPRMGRDGMARVSRHRLKPDRAPRRGTGV